MQFVEGPQGPRKLSEAGFREGKRDHWRAMQFIKAQKKPSKAQTSEAAVGAVFAAAGQEVTLDQSLPANVAALQANEAFILGNKGKKLPFLTGVFTQANMGTTVGAFEQGVQWQTIDPSIPITVSSNTTPVDTDGETFNPVEGCECDQCMAARGESGKIGLDDAWDED